MSREIIWSAFQFYVIYFAIASSLLVQRSQIYMYAPRNGEKTVCVSVCVCLYMCLCVFQNVCLSICLCIDLPTRASLFPCIRLHRCVTLPTPTHVEPFRLCVLPTYHLAFTQLVAFQRQRSRTPSYQYTCTYQSHICIHINSFKGYYWSVFQLNSLLHHCTQLPSPMMAIVNLSPFSI